MDRDQSMSFRTIIEHDSDQILKLEDMLFSSQLHGRLLSLSAWFLKVCMPDVIWAGINTCCSKGVLTKILMSMLLRKRICYCCECYAHHLNSTTGWTPADEWGIAPTLGRSYQTAMNPSLLGCYGHWRNSGTYVACDSAEVQTVTDGYIVPQLKARLLSHQLT